MDIFTHTIGLLLCSPTIDVCRYDSSVWFSYIMSAFGCSIWIFLTEVFGVISNYLRENLKRGGFENGCKVFLGSLTLATSARLIVTLFGEVPLNSGLVILGLLAHVLYMTNRSFVCRENS